jgi:type 1 glutamine amidotransferase
MRVVFLLLAAAVTSYAQAPPPMLSASVRLEDWALFRSAASGVLGWRIGISAGSFPQLTFSEAAAKADALGLAAIQGVSTQKFSAEIPKKLDYNLAPGERTAVRDRLRALNMRMPAYFTPTIAADESSARKLFEFAKNLGVETIVSGPGAESFALVDKLANEYGINVAVYDRDPKKALAAVDGRSRRMGVRADTALALVRDRLMAINLRGHSDLTELMRDVYRSEIKPLFITVDTTSGGDPFTDLSRSFEGLDKALHPVMADRVNQISRTAAIRGPDRLPPDERQKIEAALPQQAPAKPKKPRRLLVLDLNVAYPGHRSIPHANLALELMGKRTGAYEAVFSNDLDNLKYDKIRQFDAVYLNNTVGMIFVDPEVRAGLTRFVREGGGLAGNHGTSHASMDWAEFGEMIGVKWGVHRENTEQATIRIDEPNHPLTAAFSGKELVYQDEFFRFPIGPYSREKLRVLLSIDVDKTDMNQGRPCAKPCVRSDSDYAVSWIRSYGKGRVFFCILGHNPTLFMTPQLAQYFLAGIQFILGDLEADTTPSAARRSP